MLSEKDILNAKEIYLSEKGELLIPMENRNVGYVFTKKTLSWKTTKIWYSWKVYNKAISGMEALKIMADWNSESNQNNVLLEKAIIFATDKHAGQLRKGTNLPYIIHPLEVMQILSSMDADINLMIAGVLHDTVEDTDTSLNEIEEFFGKDVASLVASNSEDKSKSWDERKKHTIDSLSSAGYREKLLIMADKLSNLRSIASDYARIGDDLWERFNAPREKQAWYYDKIQDALYDMQFFPECEDAYWEFVGLFKDVFVMYFYDRDNETLFQVCDTGDIFYLHRGDPQWHSSDDDIEEISKKVMSLDKPVFAKTPFILESAIILPRKEAEFYEDIWNAKYKFSE